MQRISWTPVSFDLPAHCSMAARVFAEFCARPVEQLRNWHGLSVEQLDARLEGTDNHVGWLLWHAGRQLDMQLAEITHARQVWEQYSSRLGLGPVGETMGYGHSPEEVAEVRPRDAAVLCEYVEAGLRACVAAVVAMDDAELDTVVDTRWDPPVTTMMRLVSVVDDCTQHLAQAAFILGAQ